MSIGASAPPGAITSDHSGGLLDFVRTAILSLQHFAEQTNDDAELAQVHACITKLQQILAGHAKDRKAALGMTPAMRTVSARWRATERHVGRTANAREPQSAREFTSRGAQPP
jgi:hypothetical protein